MNKTTKDKSENKEFPSKRLRTVRSFVCRNTQLPPSKAQLFQALWPCYGMENWQTLPRLSLKTLFPEVRPIVLEIGFGTGESLFEMAKNTPEVNFIGIEVYRRGIVSLLAKLEHHPLSNLKLFQQDANDILTCLEAESLSRIQIFFPDPWPKARHHKRRLIQPAFVAVLASKLHAGGILHLASDWQAYAEQMMRVLSQESSIENTQPGQQYAPRPTYRPQTKYERRGIRLGHVTRDVIFKKR